MSFHCKLWLALVIAALAILTGCALTLPRSFRLAEVSDLVQCFLLASGSVSFLPLAVRSRGRMRLFWSLISLGIAFWFSYQLLWTYYEVLLRRDVPEVFAGDMVLFLHFVPLMAALALRPHVPPDQYATRLGRLDFLLLLVWWLYLYVLIVIPWQYVIGDSESYIRNLNALYLSEQFAVVAALAVFWIRAKGPWRRLYASLFGAALGYAASSYLANWAITRNSYYSGSLYDIPLALAMAGLTWIGLHTGIESPQSDARPTPAVYGVWIARCGMIAVFSLPIFAAWSIADATIPAPIRTFRIVLTLGAAFIMGVMVFFRQRLLDRELTNLLQQSQDSFQTLKRLQAQLLQSEKRASQGQLVGGAAHELNNPITAMLGYSDLLLSTSLTPEQHPLAAKIGQCVRRTKSLVASLLSFARQTPAPKRSIDLNTLVRTAVKLTQPHWESLKVEVRTSIDPALPKVLGDSNQLLQVCLQLLGNCLHVIGERGCTTLEASTSHAAALCTLKISTGPMNSGINSDSQTASSGNSDNNIALSACQGIAQEHGGQVSCEIRDDGGIGLLIQLPASECGSPAKTQETTAPVLWESRASV
ncbi:MAG TPA: HAMP domain-containing sensor histidine kinase [Verrucomicrobiae bacterium]|nr:HAMP domain-containing sensor histidine kinase [Verrucomicrobiae bacterium]